MTLKELQLTHRPYRTAFFFKDRSNMDKLMYKIVSNYLQEGQQSKFKELYAQYFSLLYLGAMRRTEPFYSKITITRSFEHGHHFRHLTIVNAKHFYKKEFVGMSEGFSPRAIYRGIGEHQRVAVIFPEENKYEAALWQFIAPGDRNTLDFSPLLYGKPLNSESLSNISKAFSERFKSDISNPFKTEEGAGIVPHMLRHARAYDLYINHNMKEFVVLKLLRWTRRDMLDWYVDIKDTLQERELKNALFQHLADEQEASDKADFDSSD